MRNDDVRLIPVPGIPLVTPGAALASLIGDALQQGMPPQEGDVLVVAQKIVSKAEGRYVDLRGVEPSARAAELARATEKDPRLVELVLAESEEVLRYRAGVLIVAHRLGIVIANAGIDASNVPQEDGSERVLLLPRDPDASAARLREALMARFGVPLAVVINDSVGRAWRNGTVGLALGAAGLPSLLDLRGEADLFGRQLQVSQSGLADSIAAAASLVQGEGNEGRPVVCMRGLHYGEPFQPAAALVRPKEEDLFR